MNGEVICRLVLELLIHSFFTKSLLSQFGHVNVCDQLMPRGTPHFKSASHVSLESETGYLLFYKRPQSPPFVHETKPMGYYIPVHSH